MLGYTQSELHDVVARLSEISNLSCFLDAPGGEGAFTPDAPPWIRQFGQPFGLAKYGTAKYSCIFRNWVQKMLLFYFL